MGCRDVGIIKLEFVSKTQLLCLSYKTHLHCIRLDEVVNMNSIGDGKIILN